MNISPPHGFVVFAGRLPLPPSVNEMYMNNVGRGKGRVKTEAARDFANVVSVMVTCPGAWSEAVNDTCFVTEIALEFIDALRKELGLGKKSKAAPLTFALDIHYVFPAWRNDLDNYLKALQDALTSAIGFNDRAVIALNVTKAVQKEVAPHADVVLTVSRQGFMSPLEYLRATPRTSA